MWVLIFYLLIIRDFPFLYVLIYLTLLEHMACLIPGFVLRGLIGNVVGLVVGVLLNC